MTTGIVEATDGWSDAVVTATRWRSNAELIEAVARLSYLREEDLTLDPTHGQGIFWQRWRPARLRRHDISAALAPDGPMDFTRLAYRDGAFDAVVFDGPYKLNGRPSDPDVRYGVDVPASWQERLDLLLRGLDECARVTRPGGRLLVKCMDQVVSGRKRWQTRLLAERAESWGFEQVDRFDLLVNPRKQPATAMKRKPAEPGEGEPEVTVRRQRRTQANYSTLLVFERRSLR